MRALTERAKSLLLQKRQLILRNVRREVEESMPEAQVDIVEDRVMISGRRATRRYLEEPKLRFMWINRR